METMLQQQPIDPYTFHVLQRIDEKVRASFTPAQLSAITTAISEGRPSKKYRVDIRGVIPLFFARYYFVFTMGRDRRHLTKRVEQKRKFASSFLGGLTLLILGTVPLVTLILLLLYLVKCSLGINIMPDAHLKDLLMFWKEP